MSNPGLAAERVSFAYPGGSPVLSDVTARVARGGLVGILGPNGSGKTTLLRLLAGLLKATSGRTTLDGTDLSALPRATVARRMAMVPQETQLAFEYTVIEMATMGRYPHLGAFEIEGPEDLEIAREALRATGTDHLATRYFNTLSGGEKQRVVIAGALAQLEKRGREGFSQASPENPSRPRFSDVLLLDEPTASLDLAYQLEIRSILSRLNRERDLTIVVSTHDLNFAAGLCHELVLLHQGRVLAAGPTATMLEPSLIRKLYGVDVDITAHPRTGQLTVIPVARAHELPHA
ncbi:MAG TPA: ABC transporter ATP-binding protein [Vicinamibacterales bacterium]|nr:ABC transporter ATP-binding protein [Vicinamibacterales bacterium]